MPVSYSSALTTMQVSLLLLSTLRKWDLPSSERNAILCPGFLVVHDQAALSVEKFQKVYLLTCQSSCDSVVQRDEARQCREQFCPTYVKYLMTGDAASNSTLTVVSSDRREIAQFCATWIIHLLEQFDWQHRARLHLHECLCAAGKDCLVK